MNYRFTIAGMTVEYEIQESGLVVRSRLGTRRLAWTEVLAAGVSPKRPVVLTPNFPTGILPGLGRLAERAHNLSTTTELLWFMVARRGKGKKLAVFNIPNDGADRDALLADLQTQVGEHWASQPMELMQVRKKFGVSNWWVYVAVLVLMALALFVLAGWLYLRTIYVVSMILFVSSIISWLYFRLKRRGQN